MIDGARRVGKSRIAEEFAKNEYVSSFDHSLCTHTTLPLPDRQALCRNPIICNQDFYTFSRELNMEFFRVWGNHPHPQIISPIIHSSQKGNPSLLLVSPAIRPSSQAHPELSKRQVRPIKNGNLLLVKPPTAPSVLDTRFSAFFAEFPPPILRTLKPPPPVTHASVPPHLRRLRRLRRFCRFCRFCRHNGHNHQTTKPPNRKRRPLAGTPFFISRRARNALLAQLAAQHHRQGAKAQQAQRRGLGNLGRRVIQRHRPIDAQPGLQVRAAR